MASIPLWQDEPGTWDVVVLNGVALPGVARVTTDGASSGLDVRTAPKSHYATLVDQGYRAARGTIDLVLGFEGTSAGYGSAADQWSRWLTVLETIRPRKAATRNAFTVSHPALKMLGISKVYITRVGPPEGEGPGVRRVRIDWVEYGRVVSADAGSVGLARPRQDVSISSLDKAKKERPSTSETMP